MAKQQGAVNQSIHPRVVDGRTQFEKSHTAAVKRRATILRALDGTKAHLRQHPTDGAASRRASMLQARLDGAA